MPDYPPVTPIILSVVLGAAILGLVFWRRRGDRKILAYVGCYTLPRQADPFADLGGVPHDDKPIGSGVVCLEVGQDGAMRNLGTVTSNLTNPSYILVDGRKNLFTVSESAEFGSKDSGTGGVAWWRLSDVPGGEAELVLSGKSGGGYPCMLSLTRSFKLLVCNYGGSLSSFQVGSGSSEPPVRSQTWKHDQVLQHEGSSVDADRQEAAHVHSAVIHPHRDLVFVSDLGTDEVVSYSLGSESKLRRLHSFKAPPGSGPRHMAINPVKTDFAVVICEMSGLVIPLRITNDEGELAKAGPAVEIYPPSWPREGGEAVAHFNQGRWAADVCWSPNGKFCYASARLMNTIVVFELEDDGGVLSERQRISSGGLTPRSISLTPDGSLLLVAHQHSHDVTSFRVSLLNGELTSTGHSAHVPCASCVKIS